VKKYKLLNQDRTTRKGYDNETEWPMGQWREAKGDGGLCSDGMLHCYDDPYLAQLLNPIHAGITNPIVCEVEVDGANASSGQLKCGYKRMRVVRELDIKAPTLKQRVEFARWCELLGNDDSDFATAWAANWLTENDRSAAWSAAWSAESIARSAAWSAVWLVESIVELSLVDVAHFVMGVD